MGRLPVLRRLLTPRWLAGHLLAVVLVVGMLGLAGWQLFRATAGNALSWGYTLQWPVFAGFVVLIWAREMRRELRRSRPAPPRPATPDSERLASARRPVVTRRAAPEIVYQDADDPELAAYNRYLAWLNAHPGARPADYPG